MTVSVVPLRRVMRVVNGGTPTQDPENWDGGIPWATPVDLARVDLATVADTDRTLTTAGVRSSSIVPKDSLVLSTRAPIGYVAKAGEPMSFNQGCKGLIASTDIDPRFAQYWLWASRSDLQALGSGSTFLELSNEALLSFAIPLPRAQEQRRIADFLDDQSTRIDQIIAGRERQIELSVEEFNSHRAALMVAAERDATHGTLPFGRLSVTGLVEIGRGHVISKEDIEAFPGDCPVYSSARDNDGAIGAYGMYMFDEELVTWSVDGGGHVFYRRRHKFSVTNICAYCRVLAADVLDTRYLAVAMQDQHSKFNFDWQDKAHPGVVRNLYQIVLPSLQGQRKLVEQLAQHELAIRRVTNTLGKSIGLLQEFKRSLISAAVSGEFDVSTASGRGVPA